MHQVIATDETFYDIQSLASAVLKAISEKPDRRFILALAGAPGSGKSTVAELLVKTVEDQRPDLNTAVVPMDGFHLDNLVLDRCDLRARKGSPQTFDAYGYINTIARIREDHETIWTPFFDRTMDLSRAGSIEINQSNRLVLTEGNYLLLDEEPWRQISKLADKILLLDVAMPTLEERLIQRWLDHGFSEEQARKKVKDNDLQNARYILEHSLSSDWRLVNE
jgi:pantothenate kinase